MKTALALFNWYFENYEKQGSNKYRLDAADLKICLKEHVRELTKATSDSTALEIVMLKVKDLYSKSTPKTEVFYHNLYKSLEELKSRAKI